MGKPPWFWPSSRALALEYNRVQFTLTCCPGHHGLFHSWQWQGACCAWRRADGPPHLCRALCGRHGPQHHDASACGDGTGLCYLPMYPGRRSMRSLRATVYARLDGEEAQVAL